MNFNEFRNEFDGSVLTMPTRDVGSVAEERDTILIAISEADRFGFHGTRAALVEMLQILDDDV